MNMVKNLEREAGEIEITRQHYLESLNRQRIESLNKRSAPDYFRLCSEFGMSLEDVEDMSLYERGHLESNGELNTPKKGYFGRGRVPKHIYQELIKQAGIKRIKPWNTFNNIPEKRDLLKRVMGYKQLKTNLGYALIDECDDSRIGQAFLKSYKSACRATGLTH